MKIELPELYQNSLVDEIKEKIIRISEMDNTDRYFLNGIIRQIRPKKVLELGVSSGASSAIILNAINDIPDAVLYSLDYCTNYYLDESKETGFIVEQEFPHLLDKWKFRAGGMSCKYLDEIGGDIDMCFIDTVHRVPGEILNFLEILPYMKKNGVIVLHDTALHIFRDKQEENCNCILLSTIKGVKIVPRCHETPYIPNIGAAILDDNAKERIFDIFNLLSLPWKYTLNDEDIDILYNHFKKHYKREYCELFLDSANFYSKDLGAQLYSDSIVKCQL